MISARHVWTKETTSRLRSPSGRPLLSLGSPETTRLLADGHSRSTLHDLVQFFIVCGLVLQNDAEFKSYTTILISLRAGPGIPYDVSAAVRKQHKKFDQRKSAYSKERWYPNQVALESLGVFFGPKALRSLPNPPVDVMQVVSPQVIQFSVCDLLSGLVNILVFEC